MSRSAPGSWGGLQRHPTVGAWLRLDCSLQAIALGGPVGIAVLVQLPVGTDPGEDKNHTTLLGFASERGFWHARLLCAYLFSPSSRPHRFRDRCWWWVCTNSAWHAADMILFPKAACRDLRFATLRRLRVVHLNENSP